MVLEAGQKAVAGAGVKYGKIEQGCGGVCCWASARRRMRCGRISRPTGDAVGRRVEIEFVGDRLAVVRLAQAYAIVVPERRRVIGSERRDDEQQWDLAGAGADGQGGSDLRARGVGGSGPRADEP